MRLGIDASNIRAGGGGVAHLREVLTAADPNAVGIDEVFVWAGRDTLATLPDRTWLRRMHDPQLDAGLVRRTAWRFFALDKQLKEHGADVLFVPGGIYTGRFRPFVTMSQNMLPFQAGERQRYGWSLGRLRLELIRRAQSRTFRAADSVIFPTDTGRRIVGEQIDLPDNQVSLIYCGVNNDYRMKPREQKPIAAYSIDVPFKWIYVSRVEPYKHQWNVVAAVGTLRREGLPVALDLVGNGAAATHKRLRAAVAEWDPNGDYVRELGTVAEVVENLKEADGAVFASSCETPGFVLLESMAAGLPIACADRSAMPEVLADGGEYFDPEDPTSIADAMRRMLNSPERRLELANTAFARSQKYTWTDCARDTLRLIADTAKSHRRQA
jgi:glycosyltransferase involved in cell wall biosynthesis